METIEIWKDVIGYEGYYQVSNLGNVRSIDHQTIKKNRWSGTTVQSIKGRVLKQGLNGGRKGTKYPCVILTIGNSSTQIGYSVHRLVAIAFVPNPYSKLEVNHKDGNKLNNYFNNLEWCTRKENVQHSVNAGSIFRDGVHPLAKITLSKVIEIKKQLSDGIKQCEIARQHNIKQYTVQNISSGKTWKHITI